MYIISILILKAHTGISLFNEGQTFTYIYQLNLVFLVLTPSVQFSCYFSFGWLHLQLHKIIVWITYMYIHPKGTTPWNLYNAPTPERNLIQQMHIYSLKLSICMYGFIETQRKKAASPCGVGHWIWNLESLVENLHPTALWWEARWPQG